MSLIRKASLPFSAITSTAQARMRSKRSRLRCWVGTSRAIRRLSAAVSDWFGLVFRLVINSPQKALDASNTIVYRFSQIRDILAFLQWKGYSMSDHPILIIGGGGKTGGCVNARL